MLHLQVLGSFRVIDPAGGAIVFPPHRLALLALLAASGERGMARDRLLAYLWPEATPDKARRALEQMLHTLRISLENRAALLGNPLRLDDAIISSDLTEFHAAAEGGDNARAVRLYAGPFLDGFYLSGYPEFESWVESERARLAVKYAICLERVANDATAGGDHLRAVEVLRTLASESPLSGRVVTLLMEALAATGDREGALESAARYSDRARTELGVEPDPQVTALVEGIRAGADARISHRGTAHHAESIRTDSAATHPQDFAAGDRVGRRVRTWPLGRGVLVIGLGVAGLMALTWWRTRPTSPSVVLSPYRIAVFPFVVRAQPELAYWGEGLMDLLGATLDGAGDVRRVDPNAVMSRLRSRSENGAVDLPVAGRISAELGAGRFVLGSVAALGEPVIVSAFLYDLASPGAPIREATAQAPSDSLPNVIMMLARGLLTGMAAGAGARLTDISTIATGNMDALKSYLRGESLIRIGLYDSAATLLSRATKLDSTFALAWYRLALTQGWGARGDYLRSLTRAAEHAHRLPERDRLLLQANHAFATADWGRAESSAVRATSRYPDNAEGWYRLAITRIFASSIQGRRASSARQPLLRAFMLDSTQPEFANGLANLAVYERTLKDLPRFLPLLIRDADGVRAAASFRALLAFSSGDPASRDTLARILNVGDGETGAWVGLNLAFATDSLDAVQTAWRHVADADNPISSWARANLAALGAARGRWSESRAAFSRFVTPSVLPHSIPIWYAALPWFQRPDSELRQLRDSLRRFTLPDAPELGIAAFRGLGIPPALNPWLKEYLLGLASARLGEADEAIGLAVRMERATKPVDAIGLRHDLALEIRALVMLKEGRSDEALRLLERQSIRLASWNQTFGSPFLRRSFGRFLRAELLAQSGRETEALDWFSGFEGQFGALDFVLLSAAQLRMGELYERRGDRAQAVDYYRRFAARWRDADSEYQPLVRSVGARIARLADPH